MSPFDLAHRVAVRLKQAGFQAYLAGGCVRDTLLGVEPKDFDLATDATPGAITTLYPNALLAGAHFGVVLIREGDATVEVATFRTDHSYSDGRHPDHVRFETDVRADVLRRDFTINGLLMDPTSREVIDYVGGRDDLSHGVVRAIGDATARFREDHLRMLRAVRFAARLRFRIDSETLAAMRELAPLLARVAPERVRDEITRILTEGGARYGFELLDAAGLLEVVLPEVARLQGVEQPRVYHPEGDVWTHVLLMLEALRDPPPELAWGALLHDIGKPAAFRRAPDRIRFDGHVELGVEIARNILERLRFSNASRDRILALIAGHMRFRDVPHMKESTLRRFLRQDHFDQHLELHRLDCGASNGDLMTHRFAAAKLATLGAEQLKPPPLIGGDTLIRAGYQPGPRFAAMLRAVEDAQLEGTITDEGGAMQLVAERFGPPPSAPGA